MPVRERAWLLFGCENLTTKTKNSPNDESKIQKWRVFEWCSWSTDLNLLSDRAEESRALNADHVINLYGGGHLGGQKTDCSNVTFIWLWMWKGFWWQVGWSISESADLLEFAQTTFSRLYRDWKQMGFGSRRPHRVPLGKLKLQFEQQKISLSLGFCWGIQIVASQFGINDMKARMHPYYI